MEDLNQLRAEIDQIDDQMAELFCRRMRTVGKVALYKKEHGLPVLDAQREQSLTDKNACAYRMLYCGLIMPPLFRTR